MFFKFLNESGHFIVESKNYVSHIILDIISSYKTETPLVSFKQGDIIFLKISLIVPHHESLNKRNADITFENFVAT